jgi:DNA-binding PadR family transcriptional regulator
MSVPHALLALLIDQPQHGLHLKQAFESHTGDMWPLNAGQVYNTLRRLERDGLVTADAEGSDARQRFYELSEAGRAELDQWLHDSTQDPAPPRNELVIKVMLAIAVSGVDPIPVIEGHRRQLVESMQHFTKLKAHDDSLATALVVDAELFRLEGAVRWLDMAESRLARGEQTVPNSAPFASTSSDISPAVPDQASATK